MIGSGLLRASANGDTYSAGAALAVYDTDTDIYAAEVLEQTGNTLILRVSDKVLTEA